MTLTQSLCYLDSYAILSAQPYPESKVKDNLGDSIDDDKVTALKHDANVTDLKQTSTTISAIERLKRASKGIARPEPQPQTGLERALQCGHDSCPVTAALTVT